MLLTVLAAVTIGVVTPVIPMSWVLASATFGWDVVFTARAAAVSIIMVLAG